MRRHWLAGLALVAVLRLGMPVVMADHGDEGHKRQHGNKHFDDDDDQGWQRVARNGRIASVYLFFDSLP